MSSKNREIIIPEYMSEFQCIGSSCEDTCCAGWGVMVDKDTFRKYRSTKHPMMKKQLKENVTRNRSGGSDAAYAKIKMDSEGNCTLLDENRLCTIQKELGADFLSHTCAVYPRTFHRVDGIVEKSATLSCPEVARLVLLNEKGIEFIQDVEPSDTRGFVKENAMSRQQQVLFWDLRIFTIQTMQNRSLSIEERLIVIGLFLRRFAGFSETEKIRQLEPLINEFTTSIADGSLQASIRQLPTNISFQISMCKSLIEFRAMIPISSKRYIECLNDMVSGLEMDEKLTDESRIQKYEEAYENYYMPFMAHHEYMLENYLVNYVFAHLFPFNKKSVTDSFAMLIINFSMIKLHLIGMAKHHGELNVDLVIKLVQSYSKTMDHNPDYVRSVEKMLKDHDYTTLAHMVVLVKS